MCDCATAVQLTMATPLTANLLDGWRVVSAAAYPPHPTPPHSTHPAGRRTCAPAIGVDMYRPTPRPGGVRHIAIKQAALHAPAARRGLVVEVERAAMPVGAVVDETAVSVVAQAAANVVARRAVIVTPHACHCHQLHVHVALQLNKRPAVGHHAAVDHQVLKGSKTHAARHAFVTSGPHRRRRGYWAHHGNIYTHVRASPTHLDAKLWQVGCAAG